MLKLIGNVSGIGSAFFQVMILSIGLEVFGLLTPFYSQWVMDQVLVSADYDLLTLLGCAFITVVVHAKYSLGDTRLGDDVVFKHVERAMVC
jgi:ATP-binding cassette subfamily B protein RaxB